MTAGRNDASTTSYSLVPPVEECQSELVIGGGLGTVKLFFTSPPPNAMRRFIWKWALGVTWRDLRPERNLEALKKLG